MKNRAQNKSILREILSTKARFFSIVAIIFLGVAFYVGIKASSPDREVTINAFYEMSALMDNKIMASLGLNEQDSLLLEQDENILAYEMGYSLDVNLTNKNKVVKFMSYSPKSSIKLNQFSITEGRLPTKEGEIALDEKARLEDETLKVGEIYTIVSDEATTDKFETLSYEIVGFVKHPVYIDKDDRGSTTVGKGSIDYFAVITDEDFSMDVYTEVYINFKNLQNLAPYSKTYKELAETNTLYLKELFALRPEERLQEIKKEAYDELEKGYQEIVDAEKELVDGEKEITEKKAELAQAEKEYEQGVSDYENGIQSAEEELQQGENDFLKGQKEIITQRVNLENGESKLQEAKGQLDAAKASFEANGINPDTDLENYKAQLNFVDEENKIKFQTVIEQLTAYQAGVVQYEAQLQQINDGKIQLQNAENELEAAKKKLEQGKKELEQARITGQKELEEAKTKLQDGKLKLADGEKEIEENKQKLLDAKIKIDEEKAKIEDLEPSKYYFFDRTDNPGYATYGDSIESLDNIATVFPVFFFLVAILICLTTMTRMVEEKRGEIGTLKALGYTNSEIAKKFVIYATLASVVGAILGVVVGSYAIPYIINMAYASLFEAPPLIIKYYPSYIIQALILSIACTVGAALFVLMEELKSQPAYLMRPKSPKLGKKILLERCTPVWKKFNFNQKVTFRNLFRYKQRMIMTILGIAGCMAMLVTGFSLKTSNTESINKQFKELMNYDAIVIFDEEATEEIDQAYDELISDLESYQSGLEIHQETLTLKKEGINKQTVTLYVPKEKDKLNEYLTLRNRKSGLNYNLSDNAAILSEKLATMLNLSVGDKITFSDADENPIEVIIGAISENYYGHHLYMSTDYYEKVTGQPPSYNAELLKLAIQQNEETVQRKIMDTEKALNVTMLSVLENSNMDSSLDMVMWVLIIASGCLAFVVLYNLININVSERIRELSTIKVLGFFDNEVTMYIFRENIILTILGILAGALLGKVLFKFILWSAELDAMMMVPDIYMTSYVLSACITLCFAFFVMAMMHLKLKNIDMIDALKSVE